MEQLIVCKTEDWRYAVRPISWAGIWGENGLLASDCKSLAYFEDEQDAKDYIAYRTLGTADKLSALVKARDKGLLLEMPCKPGTELFGHCRIRGENPISRSYFHPPYLPKLGVDAWLTRADAEAALGGGGDG